MNTIEGSEDPSLESWKNINAINDVVELVISDSSDAAKHLARHPKIADAFKPLEGPSLAERGILTVAAVRSNVAAGGFALATAADVIVCAESAVINPHYRGVGLYGSEFHTYSFFERAGETKAREVLRGMAPMSANEACKLGLVDEVMTGGEADGYVERTKAYVRRLASEPASAMSEYKTAPWVQTTNAVDPATSLVDALIANKIATHAAFARPLVSYRHAELSEMLLDFYHQQRSKRYSDRRRAFVRKLAPKSTPLRFAVHRRDDGELKFDEEELDEFDRAEGWVAGTGVEWGWVGLSAPPTATEWEQDVAPALPPKNTRPTTLLVTPSTSVSVGGQDLLTPGLSNGSDVTEMSEQSHTDSSPSATPAPLSRTQSHDEVVNKSASTLRANRHSLMPERPATSDSRSLNNEGQNRGRLLVSAVMSPKVLRRKSDAGVRASPVLNMDEAPPLPTINLSAPTAPAHRPLRRSRSSVEWGSRDLTGELARAMAAEASTHGPNAKSRSKPAPGGRLSRWFGTTIKSIVPSAGRTGPPKGTGSARSPVNPADQIRAPTSLPKPNKFEPQPQPQSEVEIAGERQEILYPCYYNNNN